MRIPPIELTSEMPLTTSFCGSDIQGTDIFRILVPFSNCFFRSRYPKPIPYPLPPLWLHPSCITSNILPLHTHTLNYLFPLTFLCHFFLMLPEHQFYSIWKDSTTQHTVLIDAHQNPTADLPNVEKGEERCCSHSWNGSPGVSCGIGPHEAFKVQSDATQFSHYLLTFESILPARH